MSFTLSCTSPVSFLAEGEGVGASGYTGTSNDLYCFWLKSLGTNEKILAQ